MTGHSYQKFFVGSSLLEMYFLSTSSQRMYNTHVCGVHVRAGVHRGEEGMRSLGAGVTGSCELVDMVLRIKLGSSERAYS